MSPDYQEISEHEEKRKEKTGQHVLNGYTQTGERGFYILQ